MELRFLEIFCKVVELKSFSKAASALFLTQPTISSHIKALEDEAGIQLLDRLGRNVLPTKAGELLYKYAKEIVILKYNAAQALNQFAGNTKGSLIIGGSTIPGEYILPEYISRFKDAHPEIAITLKIGDSQNIIDMLIDGAVEAAVAGSKTDDKNIECREFLKDELVLVASKKHFRDMKKQINIKDLKGNPIVIREQGSGSRRTFEKALKENGIGIEDLNIAAEVGSTEAVKNSVIAGIGVSFLSKFAVRDETSARILKRISVKDFNITRHFYILTNRSRAVSPICRSFINTLLSSL